jgi:DNA-directed RNA polymerase specialized sigma24 family protein
MGREIRVVELGLCPGADEALMRRRTNRTGVKGITRHWRDDNEQAKHTEKLTTKTDLEAQVHARRILQKMKETQKDEFTLMSIAAAGLDRKEGAAIIGISVSAYKSRLRRARFHPEIQALQREANSGS